MTRQLSSFQLKTCCRAPPPWAAWVFYVLSLPNTSIRTSKDVFNLLAIKGPARSEGMPKIEPRSPNPQSSLLSLCHRGGQTGLQYISVWYKTHLAEWTPYLLFYFLLSKSPFFVYSLFYFLLSKSPFFAFHLVHHLPPLVELRHVVKWRKSCLPCSLCTRSLDHLNFSQPCRQSTTYKWRTLCD